MGSLLTGIALVVALGLAAAAGFALLIGLFRVTGRRAAWTGRGPSTGGAPEPLTRTGPGYRASDAGAPATPF